MEKIDYLCIQKKEQRTNNFKPYGNTVKPHFMTRNFTTSNRAAAEDLICTASLYDIDITAVKEDEKNNIFSYNLKASEDELDGLAENEINRNEWTIK